jgi:hypothetical protein
LPTSEKMTDAPLTVHPQNVRNLNKGFQRENGIFLRFYLAALAAFQVFTPAHIGVGLVEEL